MILVVNGINREQFNLWKHEPVTKLFLTYLTDKRRFLIERASEMWVDGAEIAPAIRGQVIELSEIADLPFEAIEEFYRKPEEENGPEPEGSERPAR